MLHLEAVFAKLRREQETARDDAERRARRIAAIRRRHFPAQAAVVEDPSVRQVLLCPGRAGKTTVTGDDLALTALGGHGRNLAYITIDQKVGRRNLWEPLRQVNHDFELGLEFRNTDGLVVAPTGSVLYFGGAGTIEDAERYRGAPWNKVVIDEAKSISARIMTALAEDILPPRLMDRRGTLRIQGTPGDAMTGVFWQISDAPARRIRDSGEKRLATSRPYRERDLAIWQGVDWEWSFHHWPLSENTALPHLWPAALEIKRKKGWADDHPTWRREFLGEWAADTTGKCYAYEPGRNTWRPSERHPFGLPEGHDWYFTMGVDFGTTDPFAYVTWAYADDYPDLLQVAEFGASGLTIRQQAEILRRAYEACEGRCVAMKGDPARKAVMHELQAEYGIPIEPAEKTDKRGAVEMMKADQLEGRVKALEGAAIIGEWTTLVWDEHGMREVEGMPADRADAGLYGYREAKHRFSVEPERPIRPGTPEHTQMLEAAEEQRAIAREKALLDPEGYDARIEDTGWYGEEEGW